MTTMSSLILPPIRFSERGPSTDEEDDMPVVPPDDPSAPHVDREPSIDPPPLEPDVEEPPDPPGGEPSAPQVTSRP
jgi:hypothetical protein